MLAKVKVAIGPLREIAVDAYGVDIAEIIRFVLSNFPEYGEEINDNDPRLLVARSRWVVLNHDTVHSSIAAQFPGGEPIWSNGWTEEIYKENGYLGLKIPVKSGDQIHICRMLAC